jgi:hypothetical protein
MTGMYNHTQLFSIEMGGLMKIFACADLELWSPDLSLPGMSHQHVARNFFQGCDEKNLENKGTKLDTTLAGLGSY